MSEKGIAALAIVAVVIVVVASVGVGVYFFIGRQAGPSGGPGGGPPGGGAEEMGIPIYPGSNGSSVQNEMKTGLAIPSNATCEGYTTSASAEDVIDWYKANMSGWTLENEISFSPMTGITIYTLLYRKSDNGAFIFAENSTPTLFGIATGSWSLIQGCGGHGENQPGGGPGGENQPGGEVDWSGAYVITDPKGDFWLGGGSPPQVIQFPPSDIIKVYMANDNQYLYVKFEMDGVIPTLPLAHDGDNVRMLVMDVTVDSDQNKSTGNIMYCTGGDLMLEAWFGSPPQAGGQFYKWAKYAFYDPTDEEYVGELRDGTLLAGGAGDNFVTIRFSLTDLDIDRGSMIDVFVAVEAESDMYHHFARDVAPSEGQWYTNIEIR